MESAADRSSGATGDRGRVVNPERRVAAPTGATRQSGVDTVAGEEGLEEPRGTPEASSFERRRSLPVKSNEFIVLRTVINAISTLLLGVCAARFQTAAGAQQTLSNERAADAHLRGIDRRQGGQTIQTHKEK